jgi:catechol 2,3-dioxygenase-like lactoylglutathione lyase family enzyme
MRLRLELFVSDMGASVAFYTGLLGFHVTRADPGYVSVRNGSVVHGLGPVAKLPDTGVGPGFTRQRLHADRGAGVEIVLEADDLEELRALYRNCQTRGVVAEALREQPWGLQDFRVVDPDGYYLRVTHGDAAAAE